MAIHVFRQSLCYLLLVVILPTIISGWIVVPNNKQQHFTRTAARSSVIRLTPSSSTALSMGILDSLSGFLNNREGDFVKLEKNSEDAFGPLAVVLYNVPSGIEDDEFLDMLGDGAPMATKKGITLARINDDGDDDNGSLLTLSLQEALDNIVATKGGSSAKQMATTDDNNSSNPDDFPILTTDAGILASTPVLLFSGFTNREMLDSYEIMGGEIYQETGGQANAACAKAVPNAMQKPLRQVLEEISGDHQDAMRDAVPEQ